MKKFLVAICAVGVLFSGCGSNKPAEKPAPVQQAAPAKVLNLGMRVDQFKAKFEVEAKKSDLHDDFNLSDMKMEDENFAWVISDKMVIGGKIDKANGLIEWIIILSEFKTPDDFLKASLCYAIVMEVLNPELEVKDRGELMRELKLVDEIEITGEAVRGNVRYKSILDPNKDLKFIAAAKDVKL